MAAAGVLAAYCVGAGFAPGQVLSDAGRITACPADDDVSVVATAAQFWALIHGFVMLELAGFYGDDGSAFVPVLAAMTANLLVALGDSPERVHQSQQAAVTSS